MLGRGCIGPRPILWLERIHKLKKIMTIVNRTRDLSTYSAVPGPSNCAGRMLVVSIN
jgi:hypothetical protein